MKRSRDIKRTLTQEELKKIYESTNGGHLQKVDPYGYIEVGRCDKCDIYGNIDDWRFVPFESTYCLCPACEKLVDEFIFGKGEGDE